VQAESVRVAEDDASKRGTSTGIVDDLFDDTSNVAGSLCEVERAELGRGLAKAGDLADDAMSDSTADTNHCTVETYRLEDAAGALALISNLLYKPSAFESRVKTGPSGSASGEGRLALPSERAGRRTYDSTHPVFPRKKRSRLVVGFSSDVLASDKECDGGDASLGAALICCGAPRNLDLFLWC